MYKNLISNIWLLNSDGFRTKLNEDIKKHFANSYEIHNTLGRSLPFVDFNINKVLVNVYKDIYKIDRKFKSSIQFKDIFNQVKADNKIGSCKMNYFDEENKEINEEVLLFKGYFSCYVVILQYFFFCYFIDEIKSGSNSKIENLKDFLQNEKEELSLMPYNYFIQHGLYQFKNKFSITDIKEYVTVIIDLIEELINKSTIDFKNLNDLDVDSLFSNSQTKEFFCYIIQQNINKKNKAFFSKLYRYFETRGYWKKHTPKKYFEFLKGSQIFEYKSDKLQSSTTSNEDDLFNDFDKLFFQFLYNQ